ncbi:MAG TPA: glycosyltransferase family 2 protein [Anaerolineales bacterium]|nr:glycosyltransferase family 2 protein [Anaerolineales bacterium]HMV95944.1 glycosyltransferase family 2 protein [Anaerolineales bacterium]HMX20476.1 glycosyltransferase family 2 protein [Anaerolineales bacterium]HMX73869.1 glycosyltransferase family 2 protein [Anaerolineales bacterium]HMZ42319.1 glycosyltransferase family 2 protein [Anaerolineales bacterium]
MSSNTTVDLVIPVFNEEGVIEHTHKRICAVVDSLAYDFKIIYVDDGSRDGTVASLRKIADSDQRVILLQLSRNFGHQAALTAGMDASQSEIAITLDGDGQHPPEMIPQMLNLISQGYDIVQTQRMDEAQPASFKKWTSGLFYRLINVISGTQVLPGAADFRALTRPALNALKAMPEYHRFLRGMVSWIGFSMVILPYQPDERIGGVSKYSLSKMIRLAMDAVFSFSLVPLYVGLSLGGILLCLAMVEMVYVLSFWVTGQTSNLAPGWSSLMFVILIVGGMLMALLGFIGVYVGYIFQEVKRRPVYLVKGEMKR